jgi:uncharacterized membrane protein
VARPPRNELLAGLLLYVLPLLVTAVVLVHVGLGVLAGALLAIEAAIAGTVAVTRSGRRPARPATPRDGSTVVLALGALVVVSAVVVVGIAVATRHG